jgi:UDP-3-O-[3-hydroxymyristoyl] glucosamine N-acyltransferase
MQITYLDIKEILPNDCIIFGNKNLTFSNAKTILEAEKDSICWIKAKALEQNDITFQCKASVIICHLSLQIPSYLEKIKLFIKTSDPKLLYIKILNKFFSKTVKPGIHPSAIIDENSFVSKTAYIGPNTVIQNSYIGENVIIYGNSFIFENTKIGKNVIINPGTVIGGDGFGYSRNEIGEIEKFPHFGGVIIEDNVEIGSNTSIDKGTLGNTVIKQGVKIDNLVHIAHNVVIEEHCMIIANSMIGGSVIIGKSSWISPSASIINGVRIGENVTIGMGAIVTKNVPDNEIWAGSPARPIDQLKK